MKTKIESRAASAGDASAQWLSLMYQLRKEMRLTQAKFAEVIGMSKDAVASWETGRNQISASSALRMATELAGVAVFNRFANRLAKSPPDLVTHLGMVRTNAYFAAGCPLALCDHAAARDLWNIIHADALCSEPSSTKEYHATPL